MLWMLLWVWDNLLGPEQIDCPDCSRRAFYTHNYGRRSVYECAAGHTTSILTLD